ncbi:MAG: hypothetical protein JSU98_06420 [Gemmatimonadales bacterium]|nr:MAG: hypothetical protein JSU98_06420 [Gemmatimonadales bacterium]
MPSNRAHPRTPRLLAVLAALPLLVPVPLGAQDFTGTYRVSYAGSALTLVLEAQPDGSVRGRLFGSGMDLVALGMEAVDDAGRFVVQGTLSAPGAPGGVFEFSRTGEDQFGFLLVPKGRDGVPRRSEAHLAPATRLSDSVARSLLPPGNVGAASNVAARPGGSGSRGLVGVWRTRAESETSGARVVTRIYMELRADGVLLDLGVASPASGTPPRGDPGGDQVAWRARGGHLEIASEGSPWVTLAQYEVTPLGELVLVFPRTAERQVWSRVR